MFKKTISFPFFLFVLMLILWRQAVAAPDTPTATILVNSTADTQANNDQCILREAMINANNDDQSGSTDCDAGNGADTITFDIDMPADINLTAQLPNVSSAITIIGPGSDANALVISGGGSKQVFYVGSSGDLSVDTLTVTYGSSDSGGGLYNDYGKVKIANSLFSNHFASIAGGALVNIGGTVTITNSTFSDNIAEHSAGLNNTGGTVNIINSTFQNNASNGGGGSLSNYSNGTVYITNSTFFNNSARWGGGVDNGESVLIVTNSIFEENTTSSPDESDFGGGVTNFFGTVTIFGSTFSNNSSREGGGIYTYDGILNISNSTFSNNMASFVGGGLYNAYTQGIVTIKHTTFSGNSASSGGGLFNFQGVINLTNTILANSLKGGDCYNFSDGNIEGSIEDKNGNIVEDGSCAFPPGGDPNLSPLANNGGFTPTHALLPDSPALGTADSANCLETDQRGIARPQGAGCDIGAFEAVIAYNYLPLITHSIP